MTQLLQQHWGVAGGQEEEPVAWQRTETHDVHWPAWTSRRPSTWQEHVAKILSDQEVHGWISRLCFQKMAALEGHATFPFTRCIRQGSVALAQHGKADLVECRARIEENKWTSTLRHAQEEIIKSAALCGRTSIGSCLTRRRTWSR